MPLSLFIHLFINVMLEVCASIISNSPVYAVALNVPWKPYGMLTGTTALPSSLNVLASKTRRNVLLSWKDTGKKMQCLKLSRVTEITVHLIHLSTEMCFGKDMLLGFGIVPPIPQFPPISLLMFWESTVILWLCWINRELGGNLGIWSL